MGGLRESERAEQGALRLSIGLSVALAAIALIVGVASGTRIVIFDGAYMLIGLILSWASLRASSAVAAGPTRRFPFGRDALAPFVVAIQGVAIAGTLLFAAGDAVVIIRDGGTDVNPVVIAAYGAVTATIGSAVAWWLPRAAGRSDLVAAEAAQWRAGAVLSIVMTVGAVAALLIEMTDLREVVQYIDPVLVLISCVVLVPIPIRLVRSGLNELLEGAPPPATTEEIARVVDEVRNRYGLGEPAIRSSKVGRKLYVEVDFLVAASQWDVSEEDGVRHAVIDGLSHLGLDVWATVALTTDRDLVD
ncbi:cation transporter [Leifsonia sp. YIM 134122]|uniref:Cation transporter n=1 Tax=Leifsonia stereocauli TaxID=3134136 RepID=A0ABU9W279_9MICO